MGVVFETSTGYVYEHSVFCYVEQREQIEGGMCGVSVTTVQKARLETTQLLCAPRTNFALWGYRFDVHWDISGLWSYLLLTFALGSSAIAPKANQPLDTRPMGIQDHSQH